MCKYIKGKNNIIADYLSRESIYLQHPQYECIKEFYDAKQYYNKIKTDSNNTTNIKCLYMSHMALASLNRINPYYTPKNPNNPTFDSGYSTEESDELTVHKKIDNVADMYMVQKRYSDPLKNKLLPLINGFPEPDVSDDDNNAFPEPDVSDDDIKMDPNEYDAIKPNDKMVHKPIEPAIFNFDISKYKKKLTIPNDIDSVSSASTTSVIEQLCGPQQNKPYKPEPIDLEKPNPSNLRRSPRIQAKTKHKSRHIPLVIRENIKVNASDLKVKETRDLQQKYRDQIKQHNHSLIDNKPYEHAWNANILTPKYYVPIKDYYGSALSKNDDICSNLIRMKQIDDPLCFNIINFLRTGNKSLIADLPLYLYRFILSGRYLLNEKSVLCYKFNNIACKVIPGSLMKSVCKMIHSECHHGHSKMVNIMLNKCHYWWPKMRQYIQCYCNCCNTCQHIKSGSYRSYKNTGKMKTFTATAPFQQIPTDIVGPLPTTISGNRYIVTIIDKFSRYCMMIPVKEISAF